MFEADKFYKQRVLLNLDGNHRLTAIKRLNEGAAVPVVTVISRIKIIVSKDDVMVLITCR